MLIFSSAATDLNSQTMFYVFLPQVHGFPSAKFKGFSTLQEAQHFLGIAESAGENQDPKNAEPAKRPKKEEEEEAPELRRPVTKRPRLQKPAQRSHISSNWQVFLSFDGGARGNPGIAGAGSEVVITERTPKNVQKHRRKIHLRKFVGTSATCNRAEWQGVLSSMKEFVKEVETFTRKNDSIKPQIELFVQGDSQLVIRQLDGTYEVKNEDLQKIKREFDAELEKLRGLIDGALSISFKHVYRVDNKVADGMCLFHLLCFELSLSLNLRAVVSFFLLGLANEAMDTKRSWTTVTVDSSDEEDCDDFESDEDPTVDEKPEKIFAAV